MSDYVGGYAFSRCRRVDLPGGRKRATFGGMTLAEAQVHITELEDALAASRAENADLRARILKLEERLGQNSRNSSKPPSSDGPAVKRPPRSRKKTKKRGGQPGHAGRTRAMVAIEDVDEIHECVPVACGHCGVGLVGTDPEPVRHQVAEIPEPRLFWHEYRLHRLACGKCGRVSAGQLPVGVSASHFGPRLHGLVALLTGGWLLSKRQAAALLALLYGLEMSPGSVSAMERRMAKALTEPVAAAHAYVKAANAAHADETSWREAKSRAWLWVAATSLVIVFMIHRRRNTEAAKGLLGEDFAGALCVDRWSAYTWVERRGLCWAHLMRDFQAMTERPSGQWYGERLVASGQRVMATWAAWNAGEIDRATMIEHIQPERARMERLLKQGPRPVGSRLRPPEYAVNWRRIRTPCGAFSPSRTCRQRTTLPSAACVSRYSGARAALAPTAPTAAASWSGFSP